jgi:predicted phage-related endonuclease
MTQASITDRLEPGSPEWRRLITPSKIAAALGFSPYESPYSMWHYMAGNIDIPESDEMRRGTFHEEGVLREFFHRHPELTRLNANTTVRVNEWFAVTPDELAVDAEGRLHMIEAKTCGDYEMEGWGQEGTDEIPEHYYSQVIPAGHGVGADVIHVMVLGPFWNYQEYVIEPDADLAEQTLAALYPFWESVRDGVEPELSEDVASYETWTKVADPALGSGKVDLPADLALELRTLSAAKSHAEKRLPAIKAALVNVIEQAGAQYGVVDGEVFVRRQRNSHGGVSLVNVAEKKSKTKEIAA